ncbi:GNAT family N-acetyltransferase [Macrococcus caseolyticus]|uniref:GNAT family N-acetyltransferase n=1 Tax=Macrococcoides caseolyticum TaxID=69966 RepID=UPI0024BC310E|nr:GNAT family N-acetyltransferase [Macrococcus caseolyticus]MDJ1090128.1 GNAT family N-acetyltransferase [Macrococcus caseolyticus]
MIVKINIDILNENKKQIINLLNRITQDEDKALKKYYDIFSFIENESSYIYGHLENDTLVSLIWAYKREINDEDRVHISYISVESAYSGRGYGSALIKKIRDTSLKNNIKKLELNVSSNNENALKLYEKLGFVTESILLTKQIESEKE